MVLVILRVPVHTRVCQEHTMFEHIHMVYTFTIVYMLALLLFSFYTYVF